MIKEIGIMTAAAALSIGGLMGVSMAGTNASTWHNLPASNPANGGSSANPTGGGNNGGNGIHDIADGAPGWDGTSAKDGGQPPSCTMHGGFQGVKNNC